MRIGRSRPNHRKRPRNDDDAVMPLINIVFLLLIFFMIAGKLSSSDPFEISPPSSVSGENDAAGELTLLVGSAGELALDGEVMTETELKAALADRLQGNLEPVMRLKADGGSKATDIIRIMEIVRDAGVGEMNLLTLPEKS